MEIKMSIEVKGLDNLAEAIAMLASAVGYGKGVELKVIPEAIARKTQAEMDKILDSATAREPMPSKDKAEKPEVAPPTLLESEPDQGSEKVYTLVEVRAELSALSKAGKKEAVQALLSEFGAEKLTEIKPEDYAALMAKAGDL